MSDTLDNIGKILNGKFENDAIHVAIAPVIAAISLKPGEHIGLLDDGTASCEANKLIGIVDPYLKNTVKKGQQFYLWLYPNTVTGMRHAWEHPSFKDAIKSNLDSGYSKNWMRNWAIENFCKYYEDDENAISPERAYDFAIDAGRELYIGHYEDARDNINNEWWKHWENITGEKAPDEYNRYFRCSC